MRRLALALPVFHGATAIPGAGCKAQQFSLHARHPQGSQQGIEQDREAARMRAHGAGAIEQNGDRLIDPINDLILAKYTRFGRTGNQLAKRTTVKDALLLAEYPAVILRHAEDTAKQPGQLGHPDRQRSTIFVHLLAKLLELGSSDSRGRQFHTVVTPGKYAVAGLMLIKYAALAEWRNIKPLFWLRIGGEQQRKQRPAIFVSILLPTIQRHFRSQIQTDLFRKP